MSVHATRPSHHWLLSGLLLVSGFTAIIAEDAGGDDEQQRKAKLYVDVVMRLKGADLAADAKTKALVDKALTANRGLPAFVDIVEAFAIKDRDADLVELAATHPSDATGAMALRVVLANGDVEAITKALAGKQALALAQALGNANDQRAVPLLAPIISDAARDLALRQEAVRALAKIEQGARVLLDAVAAKKLSAELTAVAAASLANAPWDAVKAEVAKVFPPPPTKDNQPLPAIGELAKKQGDAAHGEQVFGTICVICHQVNGKGIDYGPNLSEIGAKLGKDAIFEAILYPDAGIEFNYETTVLKFEDGNTAIGIVVSDTEQEVALKAIGGIVTKYKKADITSRTKQKTSSMPTGLQRAMTQQDLIDLVEFLSSLKKAK